MSAMLKPSTYDRRAPSVDWANRSGRTASIATVRSRRDRQDLIRPQTAAASPGSVQTIKTLPNPQLVPAWLNLLMVAQRGSTILTFLLVTTTLAVYSWTVYSQHLWGKEYSRLKTLQRNERQLTSVNESLKNQLAIQAEDPSLGLISPSPRDTVFLEPLPQRYSQSAPVAQPDPSPSVPKPLGY